MRRRVARKIEKRINSRAAECPRVSGRGYSEGTRLRAVQKLYPRDHGSCVIESAAPTAELDVFIAHITYPYGAPYGVPVEHLGGW